MRRIVLVLAAVAAWAASNNTTFAQQPSYPMTHVDMQHWGSTAGDVKQVGYHRGYHPGNSYRYNYGYNYGHNYGHNYGSGWSHPTIIRPPVPVYPTVVHPPIYRYDNYRPSYGGYCQPGYGGYYQPGYGGYYQPGYGGYYRPSGVDVYGRNFGISIGF
jgi:hypothetical protein